MCAELHRDVELGAHVDGQVDVVANCRAEALELDLHVYDPGAAARIW